MQYRSQSGPVVDVEIINTAICHMKACKAVNADVYTFSKKSYRIKIISVLLILSMNLVTPAAVIKLTDGRQGLVTVTDTTSLKDTLSCQITLTGKNNSKATYNKNRIEYIVLGTDTVFFKEHYCAWGEQQALLKSKLSSNAACSSAFESGKAAGTSFDTRRWFIGGLSTGGVLPVVGIVIAPSFAAASHPVPASIPDSVNTFCYTKGFEQKARSRSIRNAAIGGAVGTLLSLTIYGIYLIARIENMTFDLSHRDQ